jgi:hypothetical protein
MKPLYMLVFFAAFCAGCAARVSYSPPGLPISISIDHAGQISINASQSIATFFGTFSIGASLPVISNDEILLIIRDRNLSRPDRVYGIRSGRNIQVTTNGTTIVSVDANGIVVIDITEGSVQTIEIHSADIARMDNQGREMCGGVHSRYLAGDEVVVDFNARGALRILTEYWGGANETLVQAYDNARLRLIRGPVCYEGRWYWFVNFAAEGVNGWAAEGVPGDLYMCPTFDPECA